jgi:hypothetical protein
MDLRRRIDAVLKHGKLDRDEKIVLEELVTQGYASNGLPIGRAGAIPARELAAKLPMVVESGGWQPAGDPPTARKTSRKRSDDARERELRRVINRLIIKHGIPIMCEAGPGGGYYLPAFDTEVEDNHARFRQRAMTGLMKATRSRRSAYADAVIQLTFGFDGPEGDSVRERLGLPKRSDTSPPAWVQVVTKLLDRVKGDPERYADQIRAIQDQYGDIFVPRYKVRELKEELGKVQKMLGELA